MARDRARPPPELIAPLPSPAFRALALTMLLAGSLLAGCTAPPTPLEAPPDFERAWGSSGPYAQQLTYATGVAVDATGNVFVTDSANNRVLKYSSAGVFLSSWGTLGSANGEMKFPTGIAVDTAGNVYVVDSNNFRIQKFTGTGAFLAKWGSYGSAQGQMKYPRGIAVDPAGNVFVSDATLHVITKYDSSGTYVTRWGGYGGSDGRMKFPRGLATDANGHVYVADYTNDRVQKFDGSGAFLGKWGTPGTGPGELDRPYGIAVDSLGAVYVSDTHNHRVQKFAPWSALLSTWGTPGSDDGEFIEPYGIAVDAARSVFVVDGGNNRVQKFSLRQPDTIGVDATLDGAPWAGPVTFALAGPASIPGAAVPFTSAASPAGAYTIAYASGGPPGATFTGATPATGTLASGNVTRFTLHFSTPTSVNVLATLDGAPWTGPVTYTVKGLLNFGLFGGVYSPPYPGTAAPQFFANVAPGQMFITVPTPTVSGFAALYQVQVASGGPVGATLASVTATPYAWLFENHTVTFTMNYRSPGVTSDSILVNATLDGAPWSGPVSFTLQGLLAISPFTTSPVFAGTVAPQIFPALPAGSLALTDPFTGATGTGGSWGVTVLSGGPPNAVLANVAPGPWQGLPVGGVRTFTLQYRSVEPKTGELAIAATLDGSPWTGPLSTTLTGPASFAGSSAPQSFPGAPPGSYSAALVSGGPPGASLVTVTPSATQTLAAGDTETFTFHFRSKSVESGTIRVNATVRGAGGVAPWSGPVSFTLSGPQAATGSSVPFATSAPPGTYTLTYVSGGPPGATLASVTPAPTQALSAGGMVSFVLSFS